MSTQSGSFTAQAQESSKILVKPGDKVSRSLTVSSEEEFIGVVKFQTTKDGTNFETVHTYTGTIASPLTGTVASAVEFENQSKEDVSARFICESFSTVQDHVSDAIAWVLADVATIYKKAQIVDGQVVTEDGVVLMKFTEEGVEFPTSVKVPAGEISNADVAADAAIAGSKISPAFGAQDVSGLIKVTQAVTDVTDVAPTQAEMVTAFGAAATRGAGFVGIIKDKNEDTNCFFVLNNGTSYFWIAGTKGL